VEFCEQLEEITIGENVTTLGDGIDYGCDKLKTITVKSTKLNAENCGAYTAYKSVMYSGPRYEAPFLNTSKKETIKVPKNKLTAYKKILGEGWRTNITYKTF
jgi:hypothetical protein